MLLGNDFWVIMILVIMVTFIYRNYLIIKRVSKIFDDIEKRLIDAKSSDEISAIAVQIKRIKFFKKIWEFKLRYKEIKYYLSEKKNSLR